MRLLYSTGALRDKTEQAHLRNRSLRRPQVNCHCRRTETTEPEQRTVSVSARHLDFLVERSSPIRAESSETMSEHHERRGEGLGKVGNKRVYTAFKHTLGIFFFLFSYLVEDKEGRKKKTGVRR